MFSFNVDKTQISAVEKEQMTSGSVNVYTVEFTFSSDWDGFSRTAVFKTGSITKTLFLGDSTECQVPWEVLVLPQQKVQIGVYGVSDAGDVLPTVWTDLGTVLLGVDIDGSEPAPTPEAWQTALADKGDALGKTEDGKIGLYSGDRLLSSVEAAGSTPIAIDSNPQLGSANAVSSGGVYSEFQKTQPKLAGTPLQIVGFDATGAAISVQRWSNQNLLDNWDFTDPINQLGESVYEKAAGVNDANFECIDRYKLSTTKECMMRVALPTAEEKCLTLSVSGPAGTKIMVQRMEPEVSNWLRGQVVTLSLKLYNGDVLYRTYSVPSSGRLDGPGILIPGISGTKFYSNLFFFEDSPYGLFRLWQHTGDSSDDSVKIEAVKLEPGPYQTLAYKDASGKWIRNDPTPNRAVELLKCQRHMMVFNAGTMFQAVGVGGSFSTKRAIILVDVPTPLRANPKVSYSGQWRLLSPYDGATQKSVTGMTLSTVSSSPTKVALYADITDGTLTFPGPYILSANNDATARLVLDASV